MFTLVRIMQLYEYSCIFLGFFRLAINYCVLCLLRGYLREKNIATFGGRWGWSYTESEAYDSASVVPIHTRSELSSDSDSANAYASVASVASVNQP